MTTLAPSTRQRETPVAQICSSNLTSLVKATCAASAAARTQPSEACGSRNTEGVEMVDALELVVYGSAADLERQRELAAHWGHGAHTAPLLTRRSSTAPPSSAGSCTGPQRASSISHPALHRPHRRAVPAEGATGDGDGRIRAEARRASGCRVGSKADATCERRPGLLGVACHLWHPPPRPPPLTRRRELVSHTHAHTFTLTHALPPSLSQRLHLLARPRRRVRHAGGVSAAGALQGGWRRRPRRPRARHRQRVHRVRCPAPGPRVRTAVRRRGRR